jgi:TusA-related sulfurtransferase
MVHLEPCDPNLILNIGIHGGECPINISSFSSTLTKLEREKILAIISSTRKRVREW